jgi:hypothetical protein
MILSMRVLEPSKNDSPPMGTADASFETIALLLSMRYRVQTMGQPRSPAPAEDADDVCQDLLRTLEAAIPFSHPGNAKPIARRSSEKAPLKVRFA